MADADLIQETNRLLRIVLENDAKQREDLDALRRSTRGEIEKTRADQEQGVKERLVENGLSKEAIEGSEAEWEARYQEFGQKSQENLEAARQRHERYQEDLLAELRTQSELLRQIADRLGR